MRLNSKNFVLYKFSVAQSWIPHYGYSKTVGRPLRSY